MSKKYTPQRARALAIWLKMDGADPYGDYLEDRTLCRLALSTWAAAVLLILIAFIPVAWLRTVAIVAGAITVIAAILCTAVWRSDRPYARINWQRHVYHTKGGRKAYRDAAPNQLQYEILLRLQRLKVLDMSIEDHELEAGLRKAYYDNADPSSDAASVSQIRTFLRALQELNEQEKIDG